MVDWNEDGLLDLLIGNENSGQGIRLYINSGTATTPELTTWNYIYSAGSSINWSRCCPQVYDMNGDGNKDLILGDDPGKIYYYENQDSNDSPVFNGYENVQYGNVNIDLYYGARFSVSDWNEDGLPDIIASDYNGNVNMFIANSVGLAEEASGIVEGGFGIVPAVNPAQGAFSVLVMNSQSSSQLTVYDSAGRSVVNTSSAQELVIIEAGSLPTGVYTVVARNNGRMSSCRMVLTD